MCYVVGGDREVASELSQQAATTKVALVKADVACLTLFDTGAPGTRSSSAILHKSFELFRPSPPRAARSFSSTPSPVHTRAASDEIAKTLNRRTSQREIRPSFLRARASSAFIMSAGNAPAVEAGPEIEELETELLGFKALSQGGAGPKKVKILPEPWPTDKVPPASATLLSIASKRGYLAAAGPDVLVLTSTEKVRKAYQQKAGEGDVVSDFTPDIRLPVPTLRHVVFSTDGDFLVISAEEKGGLAVFDAEAVMSGKKKDPEVEIDTDQVAARALLPNPQPSSAQYFAIVLESGRLAIVDIADGTLKTIRAEGVTCVAWSNKGKAVVAGLQDGTAAIHLTTGALKGVVPRPPDVDQTFTISGVSWLENEEFVVVHSQKHPDLQEPPPDSKYHIVKSNKGWTSFTFHSLPYDPVLTAYEIPRRALPPRFSATRLRNWQPDLNDMLIITTSHTDTIAVLASANVKLSPFQESLDNFKLATIDDSRKAAVPRTSYGEDADSAFIGEALDLSSKEKILRPVPSLEEEGINEAPWPLPAYMALTHEGVLAAWWVIWNRSVKDGTRYPGLIFGSEDTNSTASSATAVAAPPQPTTSASTQPSSVFGQPSNGPSNGASSTFFTPASTFGTPSKPQFGSTGFGSPTPALMKPTPPGFGTPAFGSTATPVKPAQPAFGAPAFGSTATVGKPAQPAFGAPAFGSTATVGKPAQPAFGAPSTIGAPGAAGFGAAGGLGNKASVWGTASQASQSQANPFAAAAGASSGFAKFGQTGGTSNFSSFSSNSGTQSGFASLGQGQKSAFGGLKTEPSFGSTVTVGSGTGSTLASWVNTPAQQSGSSIFGQDKSSFNTASFESKESDMSDADDAERRKRDDATPTPQAPPPQQSQGLFGLAGGFKLGTTFSSDGTVKDDPAKPAAPANGSFFGSDFANTLGAAELKAPATPSKEAPPNVSTTPASPPKQKSLFPSTTPAKESDTPKAAPPTKEKTPSLDDAPLPPDFITKPSKMDDAPLPPDFINTKLPKSADDDLPPLAGSPGIKVEAPSSSVEVSPIDDEDGEDESDFSDEEEDGDDEEEAEEPSPSGAASKPQPSKSGGWSFQDSVNQSPRVFPPAPTPPAIKSGATSQSGRSASPAQPPLFGQPSKPAGGQSAYTGSSLFSQQAQKGSFPFGLGNKADQSTTPAKPHLPPPTNRAQQSLRSPSPVRSASTSALRARREPLVAPGAPLSASIQQSKPPTPQPQVSDLEDEEDERMREQLARPIEPSRMLDEFVAYQNYTGKAPTKTGHAAQIEMVYKDINGMVDALGWNARSIKSFTQYHKQPQPGHKVDRHTLEDVEDEGQDGAWFEKFTLCEIAALKALEDELEQELDAGRVQDVLDKLAQLARLLHEKAKLMTRLNDIRRQIINRKDPEKAEALRKAPLPKELADGQKALRNHYARLLTSLQKAEEAASILRTRVASHNAQNGKTGAVPTMDAVKKTINKMTALAEKRNSDITLLESQMRKIGPTDLNASRPSSSSSRNAATPRRRGTASLRNSSVLDSPSVAATTPPTTRGKITLAELNRRALTPDVDAATTPTPSKGYGLYYTPQGSPTPNGELAKLGDLVDESIDRLRETARRRRGVAGGLKRALVERGVKITSV
ncbi:Nn.00g048610.m01.CDS01 [Neocucurbitaria sp. VM-36]